MLKQNMSIKLAVQ